MINNTFEAYDLDSFKDNLYKIREERNVTHEELAEAIGLSPRMIYFYESGQKTPRLEVLIAIVNYFEVSLNSILRK